MNVGIGGEAVVAMTEPGLDVLEVITKPDAEVTIYK